ncbi:hypothetical protein AAGV33_07245 [Flavobacterium sp. FBOR7N2.3]|uniref:Uncharacterized protein n=1 Tax=Flavobacterium magnesitis TaxID=3138077 RepID=A0ABV4TJI7_9FLAO
MSIQNELKKEILAKCNELELSKSIKDVRKLKYDILNLAYQKINIFVLDKWQYYVNIRIYELEKNLNLSIDDKILWLHNEIE